MFLSASGNGVAPVGKDRSGALYISTYTDPNPVLFRIENDRPLPVLPDVSVADMVETPQGDLWLSGVGIHRVPPGGLGRPRGHDDPVDYAAFGRADGLTSLQCGYGNPFRLLRATASSGSRLRREWQCWTCHT